MKVICRSQTLFSFSLLFTVCQQIDKGVCALFGPKSSNIASYVNSMSRALKIPHIEARVEPRYLQAPSFSINLYPDPQQLGRAYVDVIKYFGWKQILVLYGDKEGKPYSTFALDVLSWARIFSGRPVASPREKNAQWEFSCFLCVSNNA